MHTLHWLLTCFLVLIWQSTEHSEHSSLLFNYQKCRKKQQQISFRSETDLLKGKIHIAIFLLFSGLDGWSTFLSACLCWRQEEWQYGIELAEVHSSQIPQTFVKSLTGWILLRSYTINYLYIALATSTTEIYNLEKVLLAKYTFSILLYRVAVKEVSIQILEHIAVNRLLWDAQNPKATVTLCYLGVITYLSSPCTRYH